MIEKLLFPARCPICDGVLSGGLKICTECRVVPRKVSGARCMKCSKHIEDSDEQFCYDCRQHPKAFRSGIALYEYDSVRESIEAYKNEGRCEYAKFYASEIVKNLGNKIALFEADALIPIPLHKNKLKKRGYNQASILAKEISALINVPVREDILERTKNTKDQKKQGFLMRQNNVQGTFHLVQNDVKLKTIILVDDVYTTGATIDEATRTLLSGGTERVFFITLAIGIGKS